METTVSAIQMWSWMKSLSSRMVLCAGKREAEIITNDSAMFFIPHFRDLLQLSKVTFPFILYTSLCASHLYEKVLNKIPQ